LLNRFACTCEPWLLTPALGKLWETGERGVHFGEPNVKQIAQISLADEETD